MVIWELAGMRETSVRQALCLLKVVMSFLKTVPTSFTEPSAYYLLTSPTQLTLDALAEVRITQQSEGGLQLDRHRLSGL